MRGALTLLPWVLLAASWAIPAAIAQINIYGQPDAWTQQGGHYSGTPAAAAPPRPDCK